MIDRKLLEPSNQLPEKPELGILLKGCVTDTERKAVHEAFYTFAQGDPGGAVTCGYVRNWRMAEIRKRPHTIRVDSKASATRNAIAIGGRRSES
jgi:hypothetical protein